MTDRAFTAATGLTWAPLVEQSSTPSAPSSGYMLIYPKTDHKLYYRASTGGEKVLLSTTDTQVANTILAGPTTGADAAPTFRALVIADLPTTGMIYDHEVFIPTKPDAGANVLYIAVARGITVPASLSGAQGVAATAATGSSVFTVNKIHSGTPTALGTFTFAASGVVASLAGAGGSLVAGDILQITAPGSQDATLADIGLTLKVTIT